MDGPGHGAEGDGDGASHDGCRVAGGLSFCLLCRDGRAVNISETDFMNANLEARRRGSTCPRGSVRGGPSISKGAGGEQAGTEGEYPGSEGAILPQPSVTRHVTRNRGDRGGSCGIMGPVPSLLLLTGK